jgi:pantoate--beta-alanine ligase
MQETQFVVVSVFVNPLQFGEGEDFEKYPRALGVDANLLSELGADVLFAPSAAEVYPKDNPIPTISAGELGSVFEGKSRPGHFDGMLTVVNRLFNLVQPDAAFFGAKDAQQVALVRKMLSEQIASGKRSPIQLIECETVRDSSGLALSSRNRFLSAHEGQHER